MNKPTARLYYNIIESVVKKDMNLTDNDFNKRGELKMTSKRGEYLDRIRHYVINIIRCSRNIPLKEFVEDFPKYFDNDAFEKFLEEEGIILPKEEKVISLIQPEINTVAYSEFDQFSSQMSDHIITKLNKFLEESNHSIDNDKLGYIYNYIRNQRMIKKNTKLISKEVAQWILRDAIKMYNNPKLSVREHPREYFLNVCYYYKKIAEKIFSVSNLDISHCENEYMYYEFIHKYSDWLDFAEEHSLDLYKREDRAVLDWAIENASGKSGKSSTNVLIIKISQKHRIDPRILTMNRDKHKNLFKNVAEKMRNKM